MRLGFQNPFRLPYLHINADMNASGNEDRIEHIRSACVIGLGGIGQALIESLIEAKFLSLYSLSRREKLNVSLTHNTKYQHHQIQAYSESALEEVASKIGKLDVLICTLGTLKNETGSPEKQIGALNEAQMLHYFKVNTWFPSLVLKCFWKNLKNDKPATMAFLSAKVGSIKDNHKGGWYGYRSTKAALNMIIKTASIELSKKAPNLKLYAIHPGTTDTDLSKPFQSYLPDGQLRSAQESSQYIVKNLLNNPAPSGSFLNWDGSQLPW